MAHYISYSLFDQHATWITVVILELIHAQNLFQVHLLDTYQHGFADHLVSHNKLAYRASDESFKFLPYQL